MASSYRSALKSGQWGSSPPVREGPLLRGRALPNGRATAPSVFVAFCLLLTAHCSLLTAFGQPGAPQLNSPLYGAAPATGEVSTGLPKVLKNVGIDQRLNEQIPLDTV